MANSNTGSKFTLVSSGLEDWSVVEKYALEGSDKLFHKYPSYYGDACEAKVERGAITKYDIDELLNVQWSDYIGENELKQSHSQFNGPVLVNQLDKLDYKSMWEKKGFTLQDIFSPNHVAELFYYEMTNDVETRICVGFELRNRILDIIHKALKGTNYDIYYDFGNVRISYQNRKPQYSDLDKFDMNSEEYIKVLKILKDSGDKLIELCNEDRVRRKFDPIESIDCDEKYVETFEEIKRLTQKLSGSKRYRIKSSGNKVKIHKL
jgi:hypothetical protein